MNDEPDYDFCYRVLGANPDDGWESVKSAYRRKVQANHPDRVSTNRHIEKIAIRKIEEINEAYDQLQRFRRIFGDLPPKGLDRRTPTSNQILTGPKNDLASTDESHSNALKRIVQFSVALLIASAIILVVF